MEFPASPQQAVSVAQQTYPLQQNSVEPQSASELQFGWACAWNGVPIVARVAAARPPRMRRKTCRRGIGLANKRAISSNRWSFMLQRPFR